MGNTLAIDADQRRLCVNGKPTFLFGVSYFAGLGADEQAIQEDLAELAVDELLEVDDMGEEAAAALIMAAREPWFAEEEEEEEQEQQA